MVDQFLASGSKLADALTVLGGSADLTNVISIQTILVTLLTSAVCGAVNDALHANLSVLPYDPDCLLKYLAEVRENHDA